MYLNSLPAFISSYLQLNSSSISSLGSGPKLKLVLISGNVYLVEIFAWWWGSVEKYANQVEDNQSESINRE